KSILTVIVDLPLLPVLIISLVLLLYLDILARFACARPQCGESFFLLSVYLHQYLAALTLLFLYLFYLSTSLSLAQPWLFHPSLLSLLRLLPTISSSSHRILVLIA